MFGPKKAVRNLASFYYFSNRTMTKFIKLPLRSGLTLRGLEWGSSSSSKKVVCIHGWLDNAHSFERLAPALAMQGYHVIAYDNVGHGISPHLPQCSKNSYNTAHYVAHFRDVLDSLTTISSTNSWDRPIGNQLTCPLIIYLYH